MTSKLLGGTREVTLMKHGMGCHPQIGESGRRLAAGEEVSGDGPAASQGFVSAVLECLSAGHVVPRYSACVACRVDDACAQLCVHKPMPIPCGCSCPDFSVNKAVAECG